MYSRVWYSTSSSDFTDSINKIFCFRYIPDWYNKNQASNTGPEVGWEVHCCSLQWHVPRFVENHKRRRSQGTIFRVINFHKLFFKFKITFHFFSAFGQHSWGNPHMEPSSLESTTHSRNGLTIPKLKTWWPTYFVELSLVSFRVPSPTQQMFWKSECRLAQLRYSKRPCLSVLEMFTDKKAYPDCGEYVI